MSTASPTVRFGTFEVDLQSRELRKQGMRIRLEEKPFQILELLLETPGHVVTRKALCDRLWPGTFVGYNHSLNTAVNKLRELLGDSAQSPRFVETIPRRGYRFVAPVKNARRPSPSQGKAMVAVLPFENLDCGAEQEYFADGLTEEMISQLGQLDPKRLRVIARTSAIQYKDTKKPIGVIATELGVGHILEGSIRRDGVRIRITAQLIEARGQTHLWSATYDRELRNILSVQQEVARQVGRALALELLPRNPSSPATADPEAHEAYLHGRFLWGKRSENELKKAIECFEKALSIDPSCSRSHSGIADCYGLLCWFGAFPPREAGPLAEAAALRAVALDDSRSEAHASLGLVRYWYNWDWNDAEEKFLRAIELNPSYATARQWYAAYLNSMGRFEEAQRELEKARELDPLSLIIRMNAADPLFYARQYDRAIEHLHMLLEHEPQFFPALFNLGRAYVQKGLYDEAIAAYEKTLQLSGNRQAFPALAHAYALAGRAADAINILEDLNKREECRYIASPLLARIHLGLGRKDQAFEWLQRGIEERSFWITMLKVDPVYDEIRSDPRFRDLLRQVNLYH